MFGNCFLSRPPACATAAMSASAGRVVNCTITSTMLFGETFCRSLLNSAPQLQAADVRPDRTSSFSQAGATRPPLPGRLTTHASFWFIGSSVLAIQQEADLLPG